MFERTPAFLLQHFKTINVRTTTARPLYYFLGLVHSHFLSKKVNLRPVIHQFLDFSIGMTIMEKMLTDFLDKLFPDEAFSMKIESFKCLTMKRPDDYCQSAATLSLNCHNSFPFY